MPLSCDCYGGCWGTHSEGWPSAPIPTEMLEAASKAGSRYPSSTVANPILRKLDLPYGTYVVVTDAIRVEREEYLPRVLDALHEIPFE